MNRHSSFYLIDASITALMM